MSYFHLDLLISYFRNKKAKQIIVLSISMVLNVILGFAISISTTRALGSVDYGKYSYLNNLFTLLPFFLTFGIYQSGQRLVALNRYSESKKNFLGILLVFSIFISAAMIILLFFYSFIDDTIYSNGNGFYIRIFAILIISYPLQFLLEAYLSGDNRMESLALNRTMPKVLYLLLLSLALFHFFKLNIYYVVFFQYCAMIIIYSVTIFKLRPAFGNLKYHRMLLEKQNRSYGFFEYLGSISDAATEKLSVFFILFFLSSKEVGYWSLAYSVCAPLSMISSVIGTSLYKNFANQDRIPHKALVFTYSISVILLIGFLVFIKPFFTFFYTKDFFDVLSIIYLTGIAFTVKGIAIFYNKFISSHGHGKELFAAAVAVGIVNVLGFWYMTKWFNLKGAIYTLILSSCLYYILMVFIYLKKINK